MSSTALQTPSNSLTRPGRKTKRLRRRFQVHSGSLTETGFFEALLRNLDQTSDGIDAKDKWLMYLGLRTMHAQARTSRLDRDYALLRGTWKMLWPLLNHYGLLKEFKDDLELKERVQIFISSDLKLQHATRPQAPNPVELSFVIE